MTKPYPGSPSGAFGANVVKVIRKYEEGICSNNGLYWMRTQHHTTSPPSLRGLYWLLRHWMSDQKRLAWEVCIAIYFEIEVFWNTENDNTAGVMFLSAQESSLFFSWACEYVSAAHQSTSTSPPLFVRAKRVCPGSEWCSSVSSILCWDTYPLAGHITALY